MEEDNAGGSGSKHTCVHCYCFFFPAKTNRPRFHVLLFHRACMKHEIQQIAQSSCQNNSGIEMNDEDAKIETIRPVRIE